MGSGRHFLQIPGPTNVPERVLRAMDRPVVDHRGPELPELVGEIDKVFARHARLAEATRRAVAAWDLGLLAADGGCASNSLSAVVVGGVNSDAVVKVAAERLNLALGVGLGELKNRVFRIGHLGSLNELEVLATLGGTELALTYAGSPVELGSGVAAAQRYLVEA